MALFCILMDISEMNAHSIYSHIFLEWNDTTSNNNIQRKLFLVKLGKGLTAL